MDFSLILILVFLPLAVGVILFLIPQKGRNMLFFLFGANSIISLYLIFIGFEGGLQLRGPFGVDLIMDRQAFLFILMNSLVFLSVVLYLRDKPFPAMAFPLISMLHGTANGVFISNDLFNIFVCVDLAGILAFLLIRMGRKPRQIWSGVKYLITGNVGMILFLLGCLQVYTHKGSFSITVLQDVPDAAILLLITGLFVKGGVLLMGLWLPEAHGEADPAVSALLSGVIVKVGLAPLFRIAEVSDLASGIISFLGPLAALYGALYAIAEKDLKTMLAYSTLSQVGLAISVPVVGPGYAAAHGVVKAWLFLSAGKMPCRSLPDLQKRGVPLSSWLSLVLGAMVIMGIPGFGIYSMKGLLLSSVEGWRYGVIWGVFLGTAVYYSKVIFIPPLFIEAPFSRWGIPDFLLPGVLAVSGFLTGIFDWNHVISSFLLILAGLVIYRLMRKRISIVLPYWPEELDNILGMTVVLLLVLWGVFGR